MFVAYVETTLELNRKKEMYLLHINSETRFLETKIFDMQAKNFGVAVRMSRVLQILLCTKST